MIFWFTNTTPNQTSPEHTGTARFINSYQAKVKQSKKKVWNSKRVLLKDYLPRCSMVNRQSKVDFLSKLGRAVSRKLATASTRHVQDNATSPKTRLLQQAVNDLSIEIILQPHNALDSAACNFFHFQMLEKHLNGKKQC